MGRLSASFDDCHSPVCTHRWHSGALAPSTRSSSRRAIEEAAGEPLFGGNEKWHRESFEECSFGR